MGPNEAGIALEYRFIRAQADSILRKKYRNLQLKRADLHEALPQIDRAVIDRSADETPRNFALEILSSAYGLKKGYLWNLIKRGNLQYDIAVHWREALLSSA